MKTKTFTMTSLTSLVAVAALFIAASTAFAAEEAYLFVNTTGQLESETSETSTAALNEAVDIKHNSGVILASEYYALAGESITTDEIVAGSDQVYAYIATDGTMKFVTASSPTEAMSSATDIKYNSGVQLVVK